MCLCVSHTTPYPLCLSASLVRHPWTQLIFVICSVFHFHRVTVMHPIDVQSAPNVRWQKERERKKSHNVLTTVILKIGFILHFACAIFPILWPPTFTQTVSACGCAMAKFHRCLVLLLFLLRIPFHISFNYSACVFVLHFLNNNFQCDPPNGHHFHISQQALQHLTST